MGDPYIGETVDARRSDWLALNADFYDTLPGHDRAFCRVLHGGLTPPLLPNGAIDSRVYPPPGHDFPAVP